MDCSSKCKIKGYICTGAAVGLASVFHNRDGDVFGVLFVPDRASVEGEIHNDILWDVSIVW